MVSLPGYVSSESGVLLGRGGKLYIYFSSKPVGSYMEDVRSKGMLILAANVARILTFFLSRSASMEWTQPQVPT